MTTIDMKKKHMMSLHHRHADHASEDDFRNDSDSLLRQRSPLSAMDKRIQAPSTDSNNNNGKSKKRRHSIVPSPSSQWLAYLALLAFLHMIWITRRHEEMNRALPILSPPSIRSSRQHRIQSKNLLTASRRQRARPTTTRAKSLSSTISSYMKPSHSRDMMSTEVYPSFPVTELAAMHDICNKNTTQFQNNERILISGILLHPVASEMAIYLAKNCKIDKILGLAEHLLTIEQSQRLEFLMQQVPSLKLKISQYPLNDQKFQKAVKSFRPTTIIHFEPLSFLQHPDIVATRSSMDELERMCKTVIQQRETQQPAPRLLYVVPERLQSYSSPTVDTTSVHKTMLDIYRSHFQVDATILSLPPIYGPFVESQNLISAFDKESSHASNSQQSLIHITDALHAIKSAIRRKSSGPLMVVVSPSSMSTSVKDLRTQMQRVRASGDNNPVDAKLLPIISWADRQEYPYRNHSLDVERITSVDEAAISQIERRQRDLFPCVSECAQSVPCLPSAWDQVIPLSKSLTEGCKYLLYTANFSASLSEIVEIKESERAIVWPSQVFCQVAFVSSKSALVQKTLASKEASESKIFNGNVTSNSWQLIWVDEDDTTMSEADYVMPKIDPASFVSANVTKAFYIEPRHMTSLPPLQVIWYLMAKQMDFKGKRGMEVYKLGRHVWRPVSAHKHIALFSHTYRDHAALDGMSEVAQFILQQKGKNNSTAARLLLRQLEAYAKSYRWRQDDQSHFVLVDTFLLVHNLAVSRSKRLRCEWYEEQLFWGRNRANRDLEDLSLSWVLRKWRHHGWLGKTVVEDNREHQDEENSEDEETEDLNTEFGERILVEEPPKGEDRSSSDDVEPAHHYFVKLHNAMEARRQY